MTRCLELSDFPAIDGLVDRDADGVARYLNGGAVCNSYKSAAETTSASVYAATLRGKRHVEISVCRAFAARVPYGNSGTDRAQTCEIERADESTVAILHFTPTTDPTASLSCAEQAALGWERCSDLRRAAHDARLAPYTSQYPAEWRSYKSCQGAYAGLCLPTDAGFVVTQMDGKSPVRATRYGWKNGKLVKSGVALRLRDANGKLYWEHGATLRECFAEQAHKLEIAATRKLQEQDKRAFTRATRLAKRLVSHATVTFADARAVGHCEAGIRSWCAAHNINPDSTITLAELRTQATDYASQRVVDHVARKCATEILKRRAARLPLKIAA